VVLRRPFNGERVNEPGSHRHEARQPQLPGDRHHAYLKNGTTLEKAAAMANHASMRTTQLYDRRRDEFRLDKGE
jgi:hypothetical protein